MKTFDLVPAERAALERLLKLAKDSSPQSRSVAGFLLAWRNARVCGAFDIATVWAVDDEIAEDMAAVFRLAVRMRRYPDTLGYGPQFEAIVNRWRPELVVYINPRSWYDATQEPPGVDRIKSITVATLNLSPSQTAWRLLRGVDARASREATAARPHPAGPGGELPSPTTLRNSTLHDELLTIGGAAAYERLTLVRESSPG